MKQILGNSSVADVRRVLMTSPDRVLTIQLTIRFDCLGVWICSSLKQNYEVGEDKTRMPFVPYESVF